MMKVTYAPNGIFADLGDLKTRYDGRHVTQRDGIHVYVAEIGNRLAKVGVTSNPVTRIASINNMIAHTGDRALRLFISRPVDIARVIERRALASLPTVNGSEFVEVSFEEAVRVVREAMRER